ncbi:hypothetical protein IJ732_04895 [bacterium]|nr:hypothetical protein [bacterium]
MSMNIGSDVQIHKNVSPLSSSKIEGGNKKEDVYSGFESKLNKTGDGFGVNPLGLKNLEDNSKTEIRGSSNQNLPPMTEEEKKFEEKLKAEADVANISLAKSQFEGNKQKLIDKLDSLGITYDADSINNDLTMSAFNKLDLSSIDNDSWRELQNLARNVVSNNSTIKNAQAHLDALKADGTIPENFEEILTEQKNAEKAAMLAMETALQQAEDMGDDIDIKKDSQQQPTDATDKTGDGFGVNPLDLKNLENYSKTGTFNVSEQGIPDNVNVQDAKPPLPDGETVLSSSTPTSTAPSVINTSVESFGRLNTETTESKSVHGDQDIDIKAKTIEYQTKMSDLQDLQQTTKQSLMNKLDELGIDFDKTKLFKFDVKGGKVPNCDLSSLDDDTRRNVQEMFNDLHGIGQQINDLKHKYSGNFIT